jgi:hypothetical protein
MEKSIRGSSLGLTRMVDSQLTREMLSWAEPARHNKAASDHRGQPWIPCRYTSRNIPAATARVSIVIDIAYRNTGARRQNLSAFCLKV